MKYSEEEKAMWIEDWHKSGRGAWAYAKANGLNPQTFAKWAKGEPGRRPCFVEIPAPAAESTPCLPVPEMLVEKGEVRIRIPLAIGRGEMRMVMEMLGAVL